MILATICNIDNKSKSGLLLLDDQLSWCKSVELPPEVPQAGITGMALSDSELILVSQNGVVVVLDRNTLALKGATPPVLSRDTHSILLHEGKLYAMATGLNAVLVLSFENWKVSSEQIYWNMCEIHHGMDIDHLNSLCLHEGKILISGFGPKSSRLWASADNGFVIDIASRRKLFEGLKQPHSLLSSRGSLLICESAKCRVLDLATGKESVLDGYVRGLCEGSQGLYAAVSKGRTVSKSTGLVTTNPQDEGERHGRSGIYLINRDTFLISKVFEISDLEFYDLAVVGDEALSWPLGELYPAINQDPTPDPAISPSL